MKSLSLILVLIPIVIFPAIIGVFPSVHPGMFQTLSIPIELGDKPTYPIVFPPLEDVRFGKVTIGGYGFDLVVGKKGGKMVVLFDSDGNGNLMDDHENFLNYLPDGRVRLFAKAELSVEGKTEPYYLVVECVNRCVYYGVTRREGKITVGEKEYKAALAETNSDGFYDVENLLIMVDLNGDGRYEEYEMSKKTVEIGGKRYEIVEVDEFGRFTRFEESKDEVFVPVIGEKFPGFDEGPELEEGKIKLILFTMNVEKIKSWLKICEDLALMGLQVVVFVPVGEDLEGLKKNYPDVEFIGFRMVETLMERYRFVPPLTVMVLSKDNRLIYRTHVEVYTKGFVWDYSVFSVSPSDVVSLIGALK